MKKGCICRNVFSGYFHLPRCRKAIWILAVLGPVLCAGVVAAEPVVIKRKSPAQPTVAAPAPASAPEPARKSEEPTPPKPPQPALATNWTERADEQLGTPIYSTGTANIILQVARSVSLQRTNVYKGRRIVTTQQIKKNDSSFTDGIYLLSPGPERFLASNRQIGRTLNLGILPAGEIIFGIRTPEGNTFQTGDPNRNPDHVAHAKVKSFKISGAVELWFEDLPAGESDFDYNDAAIWLRGGVTTTRFEGNSRTDAEAQPVQPPNHETSESSEAAP